MKLYDQLIPKTTPPEKQIWNDPDPRIQWALDILEPPGGNMPESIIHRFSYPFIGFWSGVGAVAFSNMKRRIPMTSNLFGFAALATLGTLTGEYIRARILRYNTEELAITKHYLMLHPEKFPEPEHMKYGDKRVFYPWVVWRRPCSGLQPQEDKSKQPITKNLVHAGL